MAVAENRPLSFANSNFAPRCPQNPWASTLQTVLRISSDSSPQETNLNGCATDQTTIPRPPVIRIVNSSVDVNKLRSIIDYLRQPFDAHILCTTHSACIEETLLKLQNLLQQRVRDLQAQSHRCYCCCCCGTAEDLVRSCATIVKQINKCSECRGGFNKIEDDGAGTRISVNRRGRVFQSPFKRRTRSKRSAVTNGSCMKDKHAVSPDLRNPQAGGLDHSNRCVDKSEYCWQWLLYSTDVDNVTSNGFREGNSSRTLPSSSTSDLSTNSDRRSRSAPPEDALNTGEQFDLNSAENNSFNICQQHSGRPTQLASEMPFPLEDLIFEDQSQCADPFGGHQEYPCSVTRRPELKKCSPRFTTGGHRKCELENRNRNYCDSIRKPPSQTPWLTVRTENKFDSSLWTVLSTMNLSASTDVTGQKERQQLLQQQRQQEKQQRDLRTMQFLSSVSPNMQLRAPPNHNPFAKNESV